MGDGSFRFVAVAVGDTMKTNDGFWVCNSILTQKMWWQQKRPTIINPKRRK